MLLWLLCASLLIQISFVFREGVGVGGGGLAIYTYAPKIKEKSIHEKKIKNIREESLNISDGARVLCRMHNTYIVRACMEMGIYIYSWCSWVRFLGCGWGNFFFFFLGYHWQRGVCVIDFQCRATHIFTQNIYIYIWLGNRIYLVLRTRCFGFLRSWKWCDCGGG